MKSGEAGLRAEPRVAGAECSLPKRVSQAVWSEATELKIGWRSRVADKSRAFSRGPERSVSEVSNLRVFPKSRAERGIPMSFENLQVAIKDL